MAGLVKLLSYGFRALKTVPKLLFGTGAEAAGKAMRTAVKGAKGKSIFEQVKAAGKAGVLELEKGATGTKFLKGVWNDIVSLPKFLYRSTKLGRSAALTAGKNGVWGAIKGLGKGAAKKMPLLGSLLMVAFELPNIFKSLSEEGIGGALVETGKAAARLTGAATGAVVGSAICPGIGTLVGWVAGEWLAGKVTGKTYSEKKEEAELEKQQQVAINQFKQLGLSDAEIQYCLENGVTPEQAQQLINQQRQGTQQQTPQQTSQVQQPQNYAYNPTSPYGMNNPFSSYNQFGMGNVYSDDMFYQQLFGQNTNPISQTNYGNPYMMYPQAGFQYSA